MSSLAAARADNFYFPTDFDPKKHGSLNKYHGSHALRERAARLDQGILVIRFEVPFHIWCTKCGQKIAKGERFNADKKAIGMYHSTKIWQFSMRHACGCIITIQSDPKTTEYYVIEGAKRKVEGTVSAAEAEVIELADDDEKARLAQDPLYRLEKGEASKKRARSAAEEVADLMEDAAAKHQDEYATNAKLRARMRVVRKEAEALDAQRKALHLPEQITLLPHQDDDAVAAALAFYAHDSVMGAGRDQQAQKRAAILSEPIFKPGGSRTHRRSASDPVAGLPGRSAGLLAEQQTVVSREREGVTPGLTAGLQGPGVRGRSGRDAGDGDGGAEGGVHRQLAGQASKPAGPHSLMPHLPKLPKLPVGNGDGSGGLGGTGRPGSAGKSKQGAVHDPATLTPPELVRSLAIPQQPGAAAGQPCESTAAANQKRKQGLQAVHSAARASVSAWRSGRAGQAPTAGAGPGKGQQPGTGVGGSGRPGWDTAAGKKVSSDVRHKAELLAKRRMLQGVGLKLPERQDMQGF